MYRRRRSEVASGKPHVLTVLCPISIAALVGAVGCVCVGPRARDYKAELQNVRIPVAFYENVGFYDFVSNLNVSVAQAYTSATPTLISVDWASFWIVMDPCPSRLVEERDRWVTGYRNEARKHSFVAHPVTIECANVSAWDLLHSVALIEGLDPVEHGGGILLVGHLPGQWHCRTYIAEARLLDRIEGKYGSIAAGFLGRSVAPQYVHKLRRARSADNAVFFIEDERTLSDFDKWLESERDGTLRPGSVE